MILLTDISAMTAETCYSAIHRLKQVIRWSNIASSDFVLKFVANYIKIIHAKTRQLKRQGIKIIKDFQ